MQNTAYRPAAGTSGGEKWYYVSGGKKCGPVDSNALRSMIASGQLAQNTKIWAPGMDNWTPASETSLMGGGNETARPTVVSGGFNSYAQPKAKKKSRWWIWLIVVLVLAAAAVCCYFFIPGFGANAPKEEPISYELEDPLVFENEECAFYVDAIGEKGDYLELDVRCVNKIGDPLSFRLENTCINSSMFDPLWSVQVTGDSTMESSITFPLTTLRNHGLLPADQIKFILLVYNQNQANELAAESAQHIIPISDLPEDAILDDYLQVEGYDGYFFSESVTVDEKGRPYYVREDNTKVYFDEIYDPSGRPLYFKSADNGENFYNDPFGRPYYFSNSENDQAHIVYYDGYGFAFYDKTYNKYYFYDENGIPTYYGNGGIPEPYEDEIPETMLGAPKPASLEKAGGSYIVHKEFSLLPTGKDAEDIKRPDRVAYSSETVYWNGEKGSFIVLGGEMDAHTGYILHTYIENNSDSYIILGLGNVVVNGVPVYPDASAILRPHSSTYKDFVIPAEFLKTNKIKTVDRIDFSVYTFGENIYVPLYPIQWNAVAIAGPKK